MDNLESRIPIFDILEMHNQAALEEAQDPNFAARPKPYLFSLTSVDPMGLIEVSEIVNSPSNSSDIPPPAQSTEDAKI